MKFLNFQDKYNKIWDEVWNKIHNKVDDQVWNKIHNKVRVEIVNKVRDKFYWKIRFESQI